MRANAIGKISNTMIQRDPDKELLKKNIGITASTVNELLIPISNQEIDTVIIWQDMFTWAETSTLKFIPIPPNILISKEVSAVRIKSSSNSESEEFMKFLHAKGTRIFAKHGYPTER